MVRRTLTALYLSAACFLGSCERSFNETEDYTRDLTPLSVNVTHAIELEEEVYKIASSPNSVASWRGSLAFLTLRGGHIIFSDIEHAYVTRIDDSYYTGLAGIKRENAPTLFVAIEFERGISAFVESDDQKGFSPIGVSYDVEPEIREFCQPYGAFTTHIIGKTPGGDIEIYEFSVEDNNLLVLKKARQQIDFGERVDACAITEDNGVIATRIKDKSVTYLYEHTSQPLLLTRYDTPTERMTSLPGQRRMFTAFGGQLIVDPRHQKTEPLYRLTIEDGLSIQGSDEVGSLHMTPYPFGGSAFNEGAIFMRDRKSNRVLVISLDYFMGQIDHISASEEISSDY